MRMLAVLGTLLLSAGLLADTPTFTPSVTATPTPTATATRTPVNGNIVAGTTTDVLVYNTYARQVSFTAQMNSGATVLVVYAKKQGNPLFPLQAAIYPDLFGYPDCSPGTPRYAAVASAVSTGYSYVQLSVTQQSPSNFSLSAGQKYWISFYDFSDQAPNYYVIAANSNVEVGSSDSIPHNVCDFGSPDGFSLVFGVQVTPPTPLPTPTQTPTATPTRSFTISPTFSTSPTATLTATQSVTWTNSPTASPSPTISASPTATATATQTATRTNTPTPTATPTRTISASPSPSPRFTFTFTSAVTATPTRTTVPGTATPSPRATFTSVRTATPSSTANLGGTATSTARASSTFTPTLVVSTVTHTSTSTVTPTPRNTGTDAPTASPTNGPAGTPTATPTPRSSSTSTAVVIPGSPTSTSTLSSSPTLRPTFTAAGTNTAIPDTETQTVTPTPRFSNTDTPTIAAGTPTDTPTLTTTVTPRFSFSITPTFSYTRTQAPGTATPTPRFSFTITQTFTISPTPTVTPSFTMSATPIPSLTNSTSPSISPTSMNTRTDTPSASATRTNTPSSTITMTFSISPTFSSSPTASQTFTATPAAGQALGGFASANAPVFSIVEDTGAVYVGGQFTTFGGLPRNRIALLSATTGQVDTSWIPAVDNGEVDGMAISGNNIYIVGSFTSVQGGVPRNYAAAFNRYTGALTTWDPNLNNFGAGVTVSAGTVYVVGYFTTVGTGAGTITRNHAAAFDLNIGAPNTWNPNLASAAFAVLPYNSQIYIGGGFVTVNGSVSRLGAAAFDPLTGVVNLGWNANLSAGNTVYSIIPKNTGTLVLSGNFTSASMASRPLVAEVDKNSGLPTSLNPAYSEGTAFGSMQNGAFLYTGGSFGAVGGGAYIRSNLAAVNSTNGTPYSWDPAPNNYVRTLSNYGSSLVFVGGGFTSIGGSSKIGFAALMPAINQVATPNGSPTNTPSVTTTSTISPTSTASPTP